MTGAPAFTGPTNGTHIQVIGARENNLRNISLSIPKGAITVVTGVSGSGKSSLILDTIAAESQRQLNETFPAFVRNRLPHRPAPDVDAIHHLSPAIVVDQRPLGRNTRSTVGTATEIYNLLRLLFSRAGSPFAGYSSVFSFNDPAGMCPRCQGLGDVDDIDVDRLFDLDRSLNDGAIRFSPFAPGSYRWKRYVDTGFFDNDKPLREYTDDEWHTLLYAEGLKPDNPAPGWPPTSTYEGVLPRLRRGFVTTKPAKLPADVAAALEQLVTRRSCPDCGGARLNARALSSRINGRSIAEWVSMEVRELIDVVRDVEAPTAASVVSAVVHRLEALVEVGLGYLDLNRDTPSLSGGEAQRVKLVKHLGSSLSGMAYVFDEPSIGLHPEDIGRLNQLIRRLRDKGNTVLVVEHDPDVIAIADHVVELGPGAGAEGGQVVYQGPLAGLLDVDTVTGTGLRHPPATRTRVRTPHGAIRIEQVNKHNLRDVTVSIPRGVLTVVTGVAGSGKSTLLNEGLRHGRDDVVVIDQSPVTGSRRSTPASYLGVIDQIRGLFAQANRVAPGLFSANSAGACSACKGLGTITTDLAFLEPVTTVCEVCAGSRFNDDALGHRLRGQTIVDVLGQTADTALGFFTEEAIRRPLRRLVDVGLGYLTLGQDLSTLSGGERQRVRLARQLDHSGQVYVLDEPTTGLHRMDTARLIGVLDRLVDNGGTVVVIEHDLDVIGQADWVIDMGPGAGHDGGRVVFAGTPADLVTHPTSLTAGQLRRATRALPA